LGSTWNLGFGWDLSRSDQSPTLKGGLATEWRVDDADKTKWVFKLRGDKYAAGEAGGAGSDATHINPLNLVRSSLRVHAQPARVSEHPATSNGSRSLRQFSQLGTIDLGLPPVTALPSLTDPAEGKLQGFRSPVGRLKQALRTLDNR
jgi:hypothetical protein